MRGKINIFLVLIFISIVGCSKIDVSGMWSGKLTCNGKTLDTDIKLNQNAKDISGNITFKEFGTQIKLTGAVEKDGPTPIFSAIRN